MDVENIQKQMLETFLPQQDENNCKTCENEGDKMYIRCLRKKFKCIVIFILLFISITQCLLLIIDKISEENLNKIVSKLMKNNTETKDLDKN